MDQLALLKAAVDRDWDGDSHPLVCENCGWPILRNSDDRSGMCDDCYWREAMPAWSDADWEAMRAFRRKGAPATFGVAVG